MATTQPAPRTSSSATRPQVTPAGPRRTQSIGGSLIFGGLIVAVATAAVWGSGHYLSAFANSSAATHMTHKVERGELLVTVTEDGNVESASNVDIKCQVAGGSSILSIVQDGATVKAGDKLVELDSSALAESINQQKIAFEKARSAKIQAEKNFEVAKLAVREYLEGTYKKSIQDADAAITIALENQRSAQNSLEHAERMFRKGYVSSLELEGQKFSVERARLDLDSARTAKDVLENFTKVKMLQDLESQRDTAEAQAKSETAAYQLEELRLQRLESQLKLCTIVAPQDGMVVYANEQGGGPRGGQQQAAIEEGAAVRERQTILRLPDLTKMQVKVNVHESKVEQLRLGMRARIRILDRELQGEIRSIANQPEPTGFFSANVKEYATRVRVDGESTGLRPGMTAEVEILVAHLPETLLLPVACVVEKQGNYFCWVEKGEGLERRELKLGLSNDQFLEIKDGVVEGDLVLLNPRSAVAEAKAMATVKEEKQDIKKRFGEQAKGAPDAGASPNAAGGPNAGPGGAPGGPGAGPSSGPGAGPDGPGPGGPGRSRSGGPGGRGGFNPMQLDRDGDGKVSKDEAPEPMQGFFDRVDKNADGFLDAEEMSAMRNRRGGGPGGPGGPEGPGGGPPSGAGPGGPTN